MPNSEDALFNRVFSSSLERSIMLTEDDAIVAVFFSKSSLSRPTLSPFPLLSLFSGTCSPSSPVVLGTSSLIFSTDLMVRTPLETVNLSSDWCFPGVVTASLLSPLILFLLTGSPLGFVVGVEVPEVVDELLGKTVALSDGLGGCGVLVTTLPPPRDICFLTATDRL